MTTPEQTSAALSGVAPGDWGKALDINHAFKMRELRAGRLFKGKPPDFRAQFVNPPAKRCPEIDAFLNPTKGTDHD